MENQKKVGKKVIVSDVFSEEFVLESTAVRNIGHPCFPAGT